VLTDWTDLFCGSVSTIAYRPVSTGAGRALAGWRLDRGWQRQRRGAKLSLSRGQDVKHTPREHPFFWRSRGVMSEGSRLALDDNRGGNSRAYHVCVCVCVTGEPGRYCLDKSCLGLTRGGLLCRLVVAGQPSCPSPTTTSANDNISNSEAGCSVVAPHNNIWEARGRLRSVIQLAARLLLDSSCPAEGGWS